MNWIQALLIGAVLVLLVYLLRSRLLRAPFGRVLSRKFIGAAFTSKLTGSPDGRYDDIFLSNFSEPVTIFF